MLGPLHGVPYVLKDLFETKGIITTAGSNMFKNNLPTPAATIVTRLKQAGAILLGKSNTPELALSDECNSPVYGRTNNPYDVTITPGGSSGGAATAIASRMVPFDVGSNIGVNGTGWDSCIKSGRVNGFLQRWTNPSSKISCGRTHLTL